MVDLEKLHGSTDARVWTEAWLEVIAEHPDIPTDPATMVGWFANAIEAGRDAGRRETRPRGRIQWFPRRR